MRPRSGGNDQERNQQCSDTCRKIRRLTQPPIFTPPPRLLAVGKSMHLLLLPGDGIGPEITAATLNVLTATAARFRLDLEIERDIVGHESLLKHGTTVRPDLLDKAKAADGLILGPA